MSQIYLHTVVFAICFFSTLPYIQGAWHTSVIRGHYTPLTAWATAILERTEHVNDNDNDSGRVLFSGLIATGDDSGEVLVREFPSCQIVGHYQAINAIKRIVFSPTASKLALVTRGRFDSKEKEPTDIAIILSIDNKTKADSLTPRLRGDIVSINFSHDEKMLELFIQGYVETAKEVYVISSDKPLRYEESISRARVFQTVADNKYFTQSGLTINCLNQKVQRLLENNTVYASETNLNFEIFLYQLRRLKWTENQLIGARSFLSPNGNGVATLYSNGTMCFWEATTGHTLLMHDFNLCFDVDGSLAKTRTEEIIWNVKFANSKDKILLLTNRSVIIFDVSKNKIITRCFPPLSTPRRGLSLTFFIDCVLNASLYDEKVLLVETMDMILAYEMDDTENPIFQLRKKVAGDEVEEEDNETLFSATGLYAVLLTSYRDDRDLTRKKCALWNSQTLAKTSLPVDNLGIPIMFSSDDKYLLFQRSHDGFESENAFFRMHLETKKSERLDLLKKIKERVENENSSNNEFSSPKNGNQPLEDAFANFSIFYDSFPNDHFFFKQYKGYTIILSRHTFDFLDIAKDGTPSLNDWHGVFNANLHSRLDKHQVINTDLNTNDRSTTLFFGTNDYLVVHADKRVTGSPKGISRYACPRSLLRQDKPVGKEENDVKLLPFFWVPCGVPVHDL